MSTIKHVECFIKWSFSPNVLGCDWWLIVEGIWSPVLQLDETTQITWWNGVDGTGCWLLRESDHQCCSEVKQHRSLDGMGWMGLVVDCWGNLITSVAVRWNNTDHLMEWDGWDWLLIVEGIWSPVLQWGETTQITWWNGVDGTGYWLLRESDHQCCSEVKQHRPLDGMGWMGLVVDCWGNLITSVAVRWNNTDHLMEWGGCDWLLIVEGIWSPVLQWGETTQITWWNGMDGTGCWLLRESDHQCCSEVKQHRPLDGMGWMGLVIDCWGNLITSVAVRWNNTDHLMEWGGWDWLLIVDGIWSPVLQWGETTQTTWWNGVDVTGCWLLRESDHQCCSEVKYHLMEWDGWDWLLIVDGIWSPVLQWGETTQITWWNGVDGRLPSATVTLSLSGCSLSHNIVLFLFQFFGQQELWFI